MVRANWEQFVIPFSGVRVGRRGGWIATGRPREWAIKLKVPSSCLRRSFPDEIVNTSHGDISKEILINTIVFFFVELL